MGGIGETKSDQRIREINEAQYRNKVDTDKRTDKSRRENAFNEVMGQKLQQEKTKQASKKQVAQNTHGDKATDKQDASRRRDVVVPRSLAELKRKAAMSRMGLQGQAKSGKKSIDKSKDAESGRVNELDQNNEEDGRRIDRDGRREDVRESQKADDRMTLRVDPDATQGQAPKQKDTDAGTGGGDQSDPQSAAIQNAEGAKGAAGVKLPQEILEAIAKAVAVAFAADGRTEMQIELKGSMLEGVTLKVAARKGKVRCSFEGCDKLTKNLIEASKGDLMRALGKKGFELDILRVR